MDEEQGLVSPIAGGIRGIRRSVSSSIFTGRAVPPPVAQPDPQTCLLYTSPSPRDVEESRMPSSA